ncbi:MAG: hypothetical protein IJX90_11110 [Blautia sp.]|nr:hypothetical protein [Blautia sp.]
MHSTTKALAELNLIDNFLFTALLDHEQYGPLTAKNILELILNREVIVRKVHAEKVIIPLNPDLHGVRLDAVIEAEQTEVSPGDVYDIEPENKQREKPLLPKRARYYHSRMDGKLLEAGASYDNLPTTWVIFITSFDPFGEDRMVYTIRNRCVELPDMDYDDGAATLFLFIGGTKGNPPKNIKDLLCFMGDTTPRNATNPKLAEIQSFVDTIKTDSYVKEAYMTWGDYIRREREEAAEEATEEANRKVEEFNRRATEADRRARESDRRATEAETKLDKALEEITYLRKELEAFKANSSQPDSHHSS